MATSESLKLADAPLFCNWQSQKVNNRQALALTKLLCGVVDNCTTIFLYFSALHRKSPVEKGK